MPLPNPHLVDAEKKREKFGSVPLKDPTLGLLERSRAWAEVRGGGALGSGGGAAPSGSPEPRWRHADAAEGGDHGGEKSGGNRAAQHVISGE